MNEFRVIYRGKIYTDCTLKSNGVITVRNYQGAELQTGLGAAGKTKLEYYIGKNDKNGVKIFEGDYLVDRFPIDEEDLSKGYNESLLPVVWCEKQLCWCVDASFAKDGSYLTSLVEYFGEFLEVKGNIHERS